MDGECAAIEDRRLEKEGLTGEIDTHTETTEISAPDQNGHSERQTDSYSQDFNGDRHASFHFVH